MEALNVMNEEKRTEGKGMEQNRDERRVREGKKDEK
jgi:hypothetical protein